MNDLMVFQSPEFGEIRTINRDGEPWFIGKDLADVLGYERATKAIRDHVDDEDIDEVPIQDSIGRMQNTPIINESGLYSLILLSRLPGAKRFKRWVTSEVLPAIRRDGGYIAAADHETPEQIMAKALLIANQTMKRQQTKITQLEEVNAEMKPLASFAESVSSSDDSILVREFAKILQQSGFSIGEKRLFEWLRENGFLIRSHASDWNKPTQRAMEMGLFELKTTTVQTPNGSVKVRNTPKITGKGQIYFHQKFQKIREREENTAC